MVHNSLAQSYFFNFVHILFQKHEFSEVDSFPSSSNEQRKPVDPLQ